MKYCARTDLCLQGLSLKFRVSRARWWTREAVEFSLQIYVCMNEWMNVCMYVRTYVYIYIFIYLFIYIYVYIDFLFKYIYIYKYIYNIYIYNTEVSCPNFLWYFHSSMINLKNLAISSITSDSPLPGKNGKQGAVLDIMVKPIWKICPPVLRALALSKWYLRGRSREIAPQRDSQSKAPADDHWGHVMTMARASLFSPIMEESWVISHGPPWFGWALQLGIP